MLSKKGLNIMS